MLKDSIDNGPYQFKPEITVKDTNGVSDIRHPQRIEDHAGQGKLRYDSDIKAINILLLGLPVNTLTSGYLGESRKEATQDESIDSAFARFNTIITSLKALDEAQEEEVVLKDKQQNFLADSLEETDDCDDLQSQATTNFKASHVDAYDLDCDDEATANVIFMENLSPIGSINDNMVESRYDSDILYETIEIIL
ncbi:hypothetical protein Tco_0749870 [Tanacetum coccineum]|uniref:Uncharacterized protein n=1 Tax=Tanacetum coccineum TaxID=301880 RepID=A0ABQ4YZN2_9ASTR